MCCVTTQNVTLLAGAVGKGKQGLPQEQSPPTEVHPQLQQLPGSRHAAQIGGDIQGSRIRGDHNQTILSFAGKGCIFPQIHV